MDGHRTMDKTETFPETKQREGGASIFSFEKKNRWHKLALASLLVTL